MTLYKELLATPVQDVGVSNVNLSPAGFDKTEIVSRLEAVAPMGAVPPNDGVAPRWVPATQPADFWLP